MQGLNGRLAFAIAAGAFGSAFQHGYNTGVLNAPQALIMAWVQKCENPNETLPTTRPPFEVTDGEPGEVLCQMSETEVTLIWAWIVAIFCVGGMIGGSIVGVVAGRLGRWVSIISKDVTEHVFYVFLHVSRDILYRVFLHPPWSVFD